MFFENFRKRHRRQWLRTQIALFPANPYLPGEPIMSDMMSSFQDIFDWIYSSPIKEWNLKLDCLRASKYHTVNEAKSLYAFIKQQPEDIDQQACPPGYVRALATGKLVQTT